MPNSKDNTSRTISIVMAITLLGKVLGLFRDRLLAVHYGTGMEANAFYTASRIPRVFFDAVFAAAIAACFIPIFSEYLVKKGKQDAFRFSNHFITIMTCLTVLLCGVGMIFTEPLVTLFADGYNEETAALTIQLTRVMFPTIIFTGVAFSFVGILQSLGNFHVPAFISAVSNLAVIAYFFTLNDSFGIYGLSVAFLIGWLLQAVIQIPSLRRLGYHYHPQLKSHSAEMDEGMRKVFALMIPVMVATWVQPINLTINSKFGSHLYDGAGVSAIEISTNLYLIIAGVFILSITNVMFPALSRLSATHQDDAIHDILKQTLRGTLFIVLPMSAGLMVVSRPLIEFIYGGGLFDAFSVAITAEGLFYVSIGMAGYAVQNILSRAYFAKQKGGIPLIAGIFSILLNLLLCLWLTDTMGIAGLAISSAISSTVYAILLLIPLELKGLGTCSPTFLFSLGRMLLSTCLMAVAAWGTSGLSMYLFEGKIGLFIGLSLTALVGACVYFLSALLLGLSEAQFTLSTVKRMIKRG